jgi:hypothetical protein
MILKGLGNDMIVEKLFKHIHIIVECKFFESKGLFMTLCNLQT